MLRLGDPPPLEQSHATLLFKEAAPESSDGDGFGRGEADEPVGAQLLGPVDEVLSVAELWGSMAVEWFPLQLSRDDTEVRSAMGMLQFCPLQPYARQDKQVITTCMHRHTHTHTHMHTCTHRHTHMHSHTRMHTHTHRHAHKLVLLHTYLCTHSTHYHNTHTVLTSRQTQDPSMGEQCPCVQFMEHLGGSGEGRGWGGNADTMGE